MKKFHYKLLRALGIVPKKAFDDIVDGYEDDIRNLERILQSSMYLVSDLYDSLPSERRDLFRDRFMQLDMEAEYYLNP